MNAWNPEIETSLLPRAQDWGLGQAGVSSIFQDFETHNEKFKSTDTDVLRVLLIPSPYHSMVPNM